MRFSGLVRGLALCAVAACSFDKTGAVADAGGGDGADAARAIDAAATPDAPPGVCTERCDGATLVTCPGGMEQRTPCDIGCTEVGGLHCGSLVPSNGVDPALIDGITGGLLAGDGQTMSIEADTGRITINGVEARAAGEGIIGGIRYVAGPPYNVFAMDQLTIQPGATVLVRAPLSTGGVTSPLVLYVDGDVEINGLIDITAGCTDGTRWCAGVGGGNGGTMTLLPLGCAPGGQGGVGTLLDETGGGGGGLGQNGAPGGDSIDLLGGPGGDATGCPGATLEPLQGGSGGDLGGEGGRGGGGGGGLQITATGRIRIRPGGGGGLTPGIWAGGGGGEGGGIGSGGGGGGAGGAILIEAPVVDIRIGAILAANGGGGGEGAGNGNGQDGLLAAAPAGGGGGDIIQHGGKGGYSGAEPEQGDGPGDGTGGGGGGAGIIRINARDASVEGVLSPAATTGPLNVQ